MKMIRTVIFTLTVCLFCLGFKDVPAQDSQESPSRLSPRKDKAAQKALKKVDLLMDRKSDPGNPIDHPGWHDKRVAHQLKGVIEKYPNTYSALTAKLRLAQMLALPDNNFKGFDKNLTERYLSELRDNYPKTWQATLAEYCQQVSPLLHQEKWAEATPRIEQVIPKIDALKFEYLRREFPDFVRLEKLMLSEDDMRVFIRDTLLFVYRKQKRDLEARRIAQFILENYPESKAAKRLRREREE